MDEIKLLKTKKKLLFRLWQFPSLSETFITAQIITAIECGFDVSILVKELMDFEESKQYEVLKEYAIPEKIIIEDFKIPENKILRLIKISTLIPSLLANFQFLLAYLKAQGQFSLSHFYRFNFYLKFQDFDIVHVQYGTNSKPLDLLKKIGFMKAKLIVSFHGHDAFFPINGWINNNGYYDDLFSFGDLIIANTPYLTEKLEALGCPEIKLKTIPVGVDTKFFDGEKHKNPNEETFKLISVGRLSKVKGHLYLIKTVKILKEKNFKVHLTIVGEGQERENLEKMIITLGLNSEVTLSGKKNRQEIRACFLVSDLYIFAAVAVEGERRETQGLATLEAQSCQLPAVVFDSGGVKYTVINGITGFIIPEYDIQKMVEKCEFLIQNKSDTERMGKNARIFTKENFDQDIIDGKWSVLYQSLI